MSKISTCWFNLPKYKTEYYIYRSACMEKGNVQWILYVYYLWWPPEIQLSTGVGFCKTDINPRLALFTMKNAKIIAILEKLIF